MPEAKQEYEIVEHENTSYRIFAVSLLSRTPHIHGDFEIGAVLSGEALIEYKEAKHVLRKGGCFLVNPFERHSFSCQDPALILSLQVPASFFLREYPDMSRIRFDSAKVSEGSGCVSQIRDKLFHICRAFFEKKQWYGLQVSSGILSLFHLMLCQLPYHRLTEEEADSGSRRAKRMITLTDYIDGHYQQKLMLGDIADEMGLNLYYLSHFFKDAFGVSFQSYLGKVRCQHARQLLSATDLPLLDISIACGFSDPKYFNRAFLEEYAMRPAEYRKKYHIDLPDGKRKEGGTIQRILDDQHALTVLNESMKESG